MHTAEISAPVLDETVLNGLRTLGDDVVAEILDLFAIDVPHRLLKLRHAILDQSCEAVVREAHGLKGSALGVGATRLARLCSAIEQDARGGLLDQVVSRSSDLEPEFADVQDALKKIWK